MVNACNRDIYRYSTRQYRGNGKEWTSLSLEFMTWLQWVKLQGNGKLVRNYRFKYAIQRRMLI